MQNVPHMLWTARDITNVSQSEPESEKSLRDGWSKLDWSKIQGL